MNKLVMYLLLAFVAFGVAAAALGIIAQASARAAKILLEAIAFLAGKSGRSCKVTIPAQLYEARRTSSTDHELTILRNYRADYIPAVFHASQPLKTTKQINL